VFTPEIQIINENVVGDEYYSMQTEVFSVADFKSTLLGHRTSSKTPKNWNLDEFKYYEQLYTRQVNATHVHRINTYTPRGPKNYNAEPSFFYFIMDPDAVTFSGFKTKLTDEELKGPCAHLKNKDSKYQIKECCWVKPSKGAPTTQAKINSGNYTRDYMFTMWGEELFLEEPWPRIKI